MAEPSKAAQKPAVKPAAAKPAAPNVAATAPRTGAQQQAKGTTRADAKAAARQPHVTEGAGKLIAVVRVRSSPRMSQQEEDTLHMLHLDVPNSCVVISDAANTMGMVHKVQGVLTWGEVSDEVVAALRKKANDAKANAFRLNPPRKGYGRKGIKVAFSQSGALGYRGEKINDLIKRMLA
jgi:large subunit ribosomal protein L30